MRIEAPSCAGLFEEAALALTDGMTTASTVEARISEEISLVSPDLDLLFVDWLSELLYRFEISGLLVARARVELFGTDVYRLGARVEGEAFDPTRHEMKVLVKAVTYHGLEVRQQGEIWVAQVIFDI